MTEPTLTPLDVIDKAIEALLAGWTRSRFAVEISGQVCFCLNGAIRYACGGELVQVDGRVESVNWPVDSEVGSQVDQAVRKVLTERDPEVGPFSFNDTKAESAQDVIELLEEAKAYV